MYPFFNAFAFLQRHESTIAAILHWNYTRQLLHNKGKIYSFHPLPEALPLAFVVQTDKTSIKMLLQYLQLTREKSFTIQGTRIYIYICIYTCSYTFYFMQFFFGTSFPLVAAKKPAAIVFTLTAKAKRMQLPDRRRKKDAGRRTNVLVHFVLCSAGESEKFPSRQIYFSIASLATWLMQIK